MFGLQLKSIGAHERRRVRAPNTPNAKHFANYASKYARCTSRAMRESFAAAWKAADGKNVVCIFI